MRLSTCTNSHIVVDCIISDWSETSEVCLLRQSEWPVESCSAVAPADAAINAESAQTSEAHALFMSINSLLSLARNQQPAMKLGDALFRCISGRWLESCQKRSWPTWWGRHLLARLSFHMIAGLHTSTKLLAFYCHVVLSSTTLCARDTTHQNDGLPQQSG